MRSATSQVSISALTDSGKARDENEDAIACYQSERYPFSFLVVADGMGGYAGGSTASRIAVESVKQSLPLVIDSTFLSCTPQQQLLMLKSYLLECTKQTNQLILEEKQRLDEFSQMGTTIVIAMIWRDCLIIAHVGDSRAYCWSKRGLCQLTKDHSLVQEMIESETLSEEEAKKSSVRNQLTLALGVVEGAEPVISEIKLQEDSRVLLCTDGLTEYLDDHDVEMILSSQLSIDECAATMINRANELGGKDNISVGIIEFASAPLHDSLDDQEVLTLADNTVRTLEYLNSD